MKWGSLSPRDQRAARVGIGVTVAAVVFRLVVLPYAQAERDARSALQRERELFVEERALISGARGFTEAFEVLGERFLAGIPRLLPGGTTAAAQAALARRVDRLAAEGPVVLTRVEPLPVRPRDDGYVELPLQVEGESDLEGLLGLLAALESGPTLIHLENLVVERRSLAGAAGYVGEAETLSFRFTTVGFSLDEDSSGTVAPPPAEDGARGGSEPT